MDSILTGIVHKHPDKKMIIFGAGASGQTLYHSARKAGCNILYFIDNYRQGSCLLGMPVKSPFDILYEDISDILILIGVCQESDVMQIKKQLSELGLMEGVNFETPLFNDLYAPLDYIDPLLGYNRQSDLMGFQIFGSPANGAKKIVVLGGSTSDPSFGGYKSWPQCLHEHLEQQGVAATVYNGAIAGYFSALELLKIIRDVLPLAPDIIITMDGVNDAIQPMQPGHPMVHPYGRKTLDVMFEATVKSNINVNVNKPIKGVTYGCVNDTSRVEIWHQNMIIIKAICRELGMEYLAFLQPTSLYKGRKANDENERFPAIDAFYSEAAALAKKSGFIIDATSILDGADNAYADFVHYTESGNRIIAGFVFQHLLPLFGK